MAKREPWAPARIALLGWQVVGLEGRFTKTITSTTGKRHFYCSVASIMATARVAPWVIGIYYRYVIQKQKVQPQLPVGNGDEGKQRLLRDGWRCVVPAALWLQSWWRSHFHPSNILTPQAATQGKLSWEQRAKVVAICHTDMNYRLITSQPAGRPLLRDWLWTRGKICRTKDCCSHGKNNGGDAKILLPRKIKWHMFYTRMCTTSDGFRNLFSSRFPNKLTQQKFFHIKQSPKDFFF